MEDVIPEVYTELVGAFDDVLTVEVISDEAYFELSDWDSESDWDELLEFEATYFEVIFDVIALVRAFEESALLEEMFDADFSDLLDFLVEFLLDLLYFEEFFDDLAEKIALIFRSFDEEEVLSSLLLLFEEVSEEFNVVE